MNRNELRGLKVGDKVRWVGNGGEADGEVVERLKGNYFLVRWADGAEEILNPRVSVHRQRARNIDLIKETDNHATN